MNSLDDPAVNNKYLKCKIRMKRWESDFMEKYGRKPTKNDIKGADKTIRESYKMYWKLKTKVLEETLLDITFSDEVESNVSINSSSLDFLSLDSSVSQFDIRSPDKSVLVEKPTESQSLVNTENIAPEVAKAGSSTLPVDSLNVDGAWGDHLSKEYEAPKKNKILVGKSSSFQLSQKKFNSSTFTKRNPRKSLSMTKSKSKSSLNKSGHEKADNLNDSLAAESPEVLSSLLLADPIKIVNQEIKVTTQPINVIQQVLSGKSVTVDRKLNSEWLERCSKDDTEANGNPKRLSGVSDSGIESLDVNYQESQDNFSTQDNFQTQSSFSTQNNFPTQNTFTSPQCTQAEVSDDDFVCNSDSEEENRNKRVRNWRRTTSDLSSVAKRPRTDFLHRTFSFSSPCNKQSTASPVVDQGQQAKQVLEAEENILNKSNPHAKEINLSKEKVVTPAEPAVDNVVEDKGKKKRGRKPGSVKRKSSESTRKATRRTTRRKVKYTEDDDNDDGIDIDDGDERKVSKTQQSPEIPIYGVEALDVVPRFAVPQDTNGDLVTEFCESIDAEKSASVTRTKPKAAMTAKEKLEAKIASGKINENFVRINLKKKVFARGKKSFNFSKYKKNQWKNKKKELASGEGSLDLADLAEKNTCFKCGGSNHISRNCPAMKSEELMPLDDTYVSEYPTLEEAKQMASQEAARAHIHRLHQLPRTSSMSLKDKVTAESNEPTTSEDLENCLYDFEDDDFEEETEPIENQPFVGHKIPQELIEKLLPPANGAIDPVYSTNDSGTLIPTPTEVLQALNKFGHKSFRPGQEKAVMRILSGQSTLVTLSTGSGKSLCYQLPAYLYAKRSHCITLVISPLVSLMDDQVTGVPGFISAAALHTGQTPKTREKVIELVKNGNLDILLVSPEAIVAGEKSTGFGSLLRQLPPIAFACIDEAHCISQWSHNFRPSYLMVCRVLMEKMGVKTILGLTATATRATAESIVNHLRIHDGMAGVISDVPLPNNLTLTISKDDQRDQALVSLLRSPRFKDCDSIIVYCTKRDECTRIAGLLRVSLQDLDTNKPKPKAKVSTIAEAYHAGLPASRRKVIQKYFMSGDTRIVVATVAFGMGINKLDIRSVIHYNMPQSFEGYVQEVGRAGRDNLPAHCHLFINPRENSDKWELRRHIYANGVDRHTIRKLLQKIFVPCSCATSGKRCPGHEVAIPVDETVSLLDVSEETISTLLCYLELHPKKFITVLSSVYVNAKVTSYSGAPALKAAAQSSPPLAMAIALDRKKGITHDNDTTIEFPVVDVAAAIGWDSGVVKSHLKNLEWTTVNGKPKRSSISVRYDTLGLRVRAPGDLTDTELDEALDALASRTQSQEISSLQQLEIIHTVMNKYSCQSVRDCQELNEENIHKSDELKNTIRQYFQSSSPLSIVEIDSKNQNDKANEAQIINDIRSLIASYRDNNFTGRAVARIFHGIQSPNYSALTWCRCRFWRAHLATDFNYISQLATKEILSMR
ncbi:ATP-dependent DNA helicase Q4 [Microplitis demolitor]|uniref:ATP-dependent DNA helicase Q4 n=1 Tax=Microplitis demolitor TaxID=69319 RepID=UPI0004CDA0B5|nr:ATP-dependent DNA helicase Q4 [Microplitis demolitor]